ncbi:MAG: hypothetical protein ACFFDH_04410 [Promethearchaeota archaeon]
MRQVKGTILITIVKGIKADIQKRGEYDRILSDRAKEYLNKRILSASWYPLDVYQELYDAICFVGAKNNPKILYQWGKAEGRRWLTTVYQSSIIKDDLQTIVEKISRHHRQLYNFGDTIVEFISDNEMTVTWANFFKDWENIYHITVGWVIAFIELCTSKKVKYSFLNKSWNGEGWTKAKLSWTP